MSHKKVIIRRFDMSSVATCDACTRLNPEATRGRAREHVAETGHAVHFVIENVTVYRPIREQKS